MVSRILAPIAAVVIAGATLDAMGATQRPLDVRLSYGYPIEIPAALTDDILGARLRTISQVARIPLGFEQVAQAVTTRPQSDQPIDLRGMSVREALDVLVKTNPRYAWRVVNGIPVMRPASAWTDCSHFLNSRLSIMATDLQLDSALSVLWRRLNPAWKSRPGPIASGGTPFSISASNATLFDVLNQVARRGSLSWFLTHQVSVEDGHKAFVSLTLMDLDGRRSGLSGTIALPPVRCAREPRSR